MTLQQIKDSLPKWITLTPKKQFYREGDEVLYASGDWHPCDVGWHGEHVLPHRESRRPIPDEVLDNQAFWVLYNKLATVHSMGNGVLFVHTLPYCPHGSTNWKLSVTDPQGYSYGMRKFKNAQSAHESITALGGEQNIIKHLSAGDLYSKWLGEQLGDTK